MTLWYEVEKFDDGTFQIASGREARADFLEEINEGCKRKVFKEIK